MGKCLNSCGQDKSMWMLVKFLVVDLPAKVLDDVIVSIKWVVEMVQYGCQKREVTSFMGKVVHRDQTVLNWLVGGGTPVQSIWLPESGVAGVCIVN